VYTSDGALVYFPALFFKNINCIFFPLRQLYFARKSRLLPSVATPGIHFRRWGLIMLAERCRGPSLAQASSYLPAMCTSSNATFLDPRNLKKVDNASTRARHGELLKLSRCTDRAGWRGEWTPAILFAARSSCAPDNKNTLLGRPPCCSNSWCDWYFSNRFEISMLCVGSEQFILVITVNRRPLALVSKKSKLQQRALSPISEVKQTHNCCPSTEGWQPGPGCNRSMYTDISR
jgi:hypothetical protein